MDSEIDYRNKLMHLGFFLENNLAFELHLIEKFNSDFS